jgi:hypothetical protein
MRLILNPIYPTLDTLSMTQNAALGILVMFELTRAGVAELADARDSKSRDLHWSCGFDPHLQHHLESKTWQPKFAVVQWSWDDSLEGNHQRYKFHGTDLRIKRFARFPPNDAKRREPSARYVQASSPRLCPRAFGPRTYH